MGPSPINYRGLFGCQKGFWEGLDFFFHFKVGGSHMGDVDGYAALKNGSLYLFFHFVNFARLYSCTILTMLSYVFKGALCL